jgi:hypothetical protein
MRDSGVQRRWLWMKIVSFYFTRIGASIHLFTWPRKVNPNFYSIKKKLIFLRDAIFSIHPGYVGHWDGPGQGRLGSGPFVYHCMRVNCVVWKKLTVCNYHHCISANNRKAARTITCIIVKSSMVYNARMARGWWSHSPLEDCNTSHPFYRLCSQEPQMVRYVMIICLYAREIWCSTLATEDQE